MHIKKLIDRVVYILQAGEIREHCHLISVYQVHIKLPYLLLNGSVDVSYPSPSVLFIVIAVMLNDWQDHQIKFWKQTS